jgi:hypothetical protein
VVIQKPVDLVTEGQLDGKFDGLEAVKKKLYSQMLLLDTWSQIFDPEDTTLNSPITDVHLFLGLSSFLKEMARKSSETYEWLNGLG